MICPNCGEKVQDGFRFCEFCGTPLGSVSPAGASSSDSVYCEQCGSRLSPGHRFCEGCGTPVGRTSVSMGQSYQRTPMPSYDPSIQAYAAPAAGYAGAHAATAAGSTRFCEVCGSAMMEGDRFCEACGASVASAPPSFEPEQPALGERAVEAVEDIPAGEPVADGLDPMMTTVVDFDGAQPELATEDVDGVEEKPTFTPSFFADPEAEPEVAPEAESAPEAEQAVIAVRFCINCGNRLGEGDVFCMECGTRVPEDMAALAVEEVAAVSEPEPVAEHVPEPEPEPVAEPEQEPVATAEPEPEPAIEPEANEMPVAASNDDAGVDQDVLTGEINDPFAVSEPALAVDPEPVVVAGPTPAPEPEPARTALSDSVAAPMDCRTTLLAFDDFDTPSSLVLTSATRNYPITEFPSVVGKGSAADTLVAGDESVSRTHLRVYEILGGGFAVEDLGATNRTYINGTLLKPHMIAIIKAGDILKLGDTTLAVEVR